MNAMDRVGLQEELSWVAATTTCILKFAHDAKERVRSLAGNAICAIPKRLSLVLSSSHLRLSQDPQVTLT
jgi:hypothetical protein